MRRGFADVASCAKALRDRVDQVFARATAQKAESRYADARAFSDALRPLTRT